MATSATQNGWKWDRINSRLEFYYRGTKVGHINASGMEITGSNTLTLPTGVIAKADLASGIYTIEHVLLHVTAPDNETIGISQVWSDCTVVRVVYWTSAALGSSTGIDILDGGTNGAGSGVIDSSVDNLNGFDSNDLSTPWELTAGDYLRVLFDNFGTAPDDVTVDIQLKVPVAAAK